MTTDDKPPAWAVDLGDRFDTGLGKVNDKVDALATTVETLTHDAKDTRLRLGRMERELDEVKDRQQTNSISVKAESRANLEQDAAIAELHTKLDKLTGIAERLEKVAGNPMVRRIAYVAGGAILSYLAAKGHR